MLVKGATVDQQGHQQIHWFYRVIIFEMKSVDEDTEHFIVFQKESVSITIYRKKNII